MGIVEDVGEEARKTIRELKGVKTITIKNRHICPKCKKPFGLTKFELEECVNKGKLDINCPYCGNVLTIRKLAKVRKR